MTPLYIASEDGHLEVTKFRFLIASGASINKSTHDRGWTPLFMGSKNGHLEVVKILKASGGSVNKAT